MKKTIIKKIAANMDVLMAGMLSVAAGLIFILCAVRMKAITEAFCQGALTSGAAGDCAAGIRRTLGVSAVAWLICFITYFAGIFLLRKQTAHKKQRQQDIVSYIYDVEKILFAAHHDKKYIIPALQRVGEMTVSQAAFLKILMEDRTDQVYLWCREKGMEHTYGAALEKNRFFLDRSGDGKANVILRDLKRWKKKEPEKYRHLKEAGLYNLMEVPVRDEDGRLVGMLGILNMKYKWQSIEYLESVSLSFGMFYNNIRLFERIREMGEMDYLTGLLNRNSYQHKYDSYWKTGKGALACIYADANGLHELNNTQGHEAGDTMLRCIAEALKQSFGAGDSYRIGGDEFVAFAAGAEKEELLGRLDAMKRELAERGYHVSIGMKWARRADCRETLDELVKHAEQRMYEDKREYYARTGKEGRLGR